MTRAPSHDLLARMADDIGQLVDPIWIAAGRRPIRHDPLLDQLRDAAQPSRGTTSGPERHRVPESRPPLSVDAVDTLVGIYVALAGWHARLNLPSPPRAAADWQKAALRQLVGVAATLAPSIADQLADDVNTWWSRAATTTGWRLDDLRNVR